jgi:hypothetical protein
MAKCKNAISPYANVGYSDKNVVASTDKILLPYSTSV